MQNNPPESNNGSILQNLFGLDPPQPDPNQPYDDGQYYDDGQDPYGPDQPYNNGQYYDDGQGPYDPDQPPYDDGQVPYDPNQPYDNGQYYDDSQGPYNPNQPPYDDGQVPYGPNQPSSNQFGPVQPNQYNQSLEPPITDQQPPRAYVEGVKARFRDMGIGAKIAVIIASVIPVALIISLVVLMLSFRKALVNAQTDVQRRNDYSTLSSAIVYYMTENNGTLPSDGTLDTSIFTAKDPSGDPYKVTVVNCPTEGICPGSPKLTKGQVYVVKKAKCQDGSLTSVKSTRSFAIWGYIENSNISYCLSSS